MKRDLDDVIKLFKKSFSSSLSVTEQEKLGDVLQDRFLREVYEQLSDEAFVTEKFQEFEGYEYKPAFDQLKKYHRRALFGRWMVWGSSVAAVIALVIAIFVLREQPVHNPGVLQEMAECIIPFEHKAAVLRLADGRAVTIGKEALEMVENDGSVVKYEGGQLSYASGTPVDEPIYNELEVPRGGECQVVLDDGTKVWLNADSRLTYPVAFSAKERKVVLTGEAYFEVKKDTVPFVVSTETGEIRVLGTSFGTSVYEGEISYTTLVSGKVNFIAKDGKSEMLSPGEQVRVFASGQIEKRTVDVGEYVGWRHGLFIFKNKPLPEIMTMLERWYDVKVILQDENLKQLKFTGDLERYDTINTFLQLLERLNEIKYEIKGKTIVLLK